jgi:ATP-binding cassette subfamily B protein
MRKFTTEIFDTGVALLAYACMLLWYDWKLALLCMIFPPVSYVIAEKMKVMVQKTGAAYKVQSGALSAATLDRATNAITYRVFGCEEDRKAAYEENLSAYESAAVRANIWNTAMPPIYRMISMTSILFILYFGGRNVLHEGWTPWTIAVFTTFLSCYTKLATKSSSAAKLFNAVHKAQVSWKRIKPLLQNSKAEPEFPAAAPAELNVDHLHFAYPNGKEIIHDLRLHADPGQLVAIVGPTGAGKTTIINLLMRFYDVNEGAILLDGHNVKEYNRRELRDALGMVLQETWLFKGTIMENIRYGRLDATDEEVIAAAKAAHAHRFISALPGGYQMELNEEVTNISQGQKQLLTIARAILANNPVLILDEATSSVDTRTEHSIQRAMDNLMKGRTSFVIAHRLSTIKNADIILVMKDGDIIEQGNHEELMAQNGFYAELYNSQFEQVS